MTEEVKYYYTGKYPYGASTLHNVKVARHARGIDIVVRHKTIASNMTLKDARDLLALLNDMLRRGALYEVDK